MINTRELSAELELIISLRKQYSGELRKLPKGKLYFKKEHGHYRPYIKNRGREKYLGLDKKDLIEALIRKKEVLESIEKLDENIKVLQAIGESYTNLEDVIPSTYKIPFKGKTRKELRDEFDKWVKWEVEQAPVKITDVKLETSDGTFVKSRAELIIYEFLKSKGIEFKYEMPVTIDGITFHPDFVIINPIDNTLILWEHFGMMDRDIYRANARRKIEAYAKAGFWAMENFICTYDFGDGELSVLKIEKILIAMGLILKDNTRHTNQ